MDPDENDRKKCIGVKVIWYELIDSTDEEAIKLFTRLNIGRIPLTNAELVKALFLSRTEGRGIVTEEWQREVSLQWDTIERELHDKDFWYFLTTERAEMRDTRIELILDFMAKEEIDKTPKDPYASFIWFNNKSKESDLRELWNEITRFYSTLKEWYKKDELYHRIGYLVASKTKKIDDLMEAVKGLKKSEIIEKLDGFIRESIKTGEKDYSELSYENDYDKVSRLLLLFNVVSLMKSGGKARFPFKEYNTSNWSLEHIHAQQSEGLKTQDEWKTWIGEHKQSVEAIASMSEDENKKKQADEVLNLIAEKKSAELSGEEFEGIKGQIIQLLSEGSDVEYVHRLSNMALLQKEKNSALNNVVFDAKRIIKMDKEGEYIPYCTKMVFMKYYTQNVTDRLSILFWGEEDRKAYIENMNEVLSDYLEGKKIEL